VVWDLPFRHGRKWLNDANAVRDAFVGGWTLSGINTMTPGAPATFRCTPGATLVVSGIQQDFRGSNTYRPNVIGDPSGDRNSITNYRNPAKTSPWSGRRTSKRSSPPGS